MATGGAEPRGEALCLVLVLSSPQDILPPCLVLGPLLFYMQPCVLEGKLNHHWEIQLLKGAGTKTEVISQ